MIYYIDFENGTPTASGRTPDEARSEYGDLPLQPGDTVAFKRGGFHRDQVCVKGGAPGAPVTYTAYGEGDAPVFCGSVDVSDPALWVSEAPHVWRLTDEQVFNVGNFVFNGDECTATLRWTEEDLCGQGDFFDADYNRDAPEGHRVLLWSEVNPGLYYTHVEAVPYGKRVLFPLTSYITVDGLCFENSGVHAMAGNGTDITVRNCEIRRIGGCVWSRELRIRFGNGIELWNHGDNVRIEHCTVQNVYDSCVTHQGDTRVIPAHRFICCDNVFDTYGMAAYEYRDRMQINGVFERNICRNAGCGFAMLGEVLPRRSEIWPQPMGHHIFLWRIDHATEGGCLSIRDNVFENSPVGAAIYSIISPEAEAQMVLTHNIYRGTNPVLINRLAGLDFASFDEYRQVTGQDLDSTCAQ